MEKSIRKSVTAFGIFASGLVAGYAVSVLSGKLSLRSSLFPSTFGSISIPKILPVIPDFEKERISIDVETHLGYNE
ncbi:hypothetical protein BH23BAC3_BH23BAC3_29760 [soil metagenome]